MHPKSGDRYFRTVNVEPVNDKVIATADSGLWDQPADDIRQRTTIVVTNPLSFEVLPIIDGKLCFRVHNPSGEAFSGVVMPSRFKGFEISGKQSLPIELNRGDTSTDVCYAIQNVAPRYEAVFEVRHPNLGAGIGGRIKSDIAVNFERLDVAGSEALKVHADGDAAVHSEQSLSPGETPESLPTGQVVRPLKLTYAFFAPGWKFIQLKPAAEGNRKIAGKPGRLGLWVFGDGSGHQLRCRFIDSAGQTFQASGPGIDFNGWRYVTLPMNGPDLAHWGKGDGEIHYPIRWDTLLLLDNVSRQKSAGEIRFAGMTLIE
jgi:hypothetical protein